jgi:hypothetical protein
MVVQTTLTGVSYWPVTAIQKPVIGSSRLDKAVSIPVIAENYGIELDGCQCHDVSNVMIGTIRMIAPDQGRSCGNVG